MTVDGRPLLARLGFHPFSVLRKIIPALFPAGKRALLATGGTFLVGVPAGLSSFLRLSSSLLRTTTPLALSALPGAAPSPASRAVGRRTRSRSRLGVDHIFLPMTAGDLSYHSQSDVSVGLSLVLALIAVKSGGSCTLAHSELFQKQTDSSQSYQNEQD